RIASTLPYAEAHRELLKTPDGTPGENQRLFPGGSPDATLASPPDTAAADADANADDQARPDAHELGEAHPVSCIDCHDPQTLKIRVTRPGFVLGIAALAASDDPVPHLPSIER